MADKDKRNLSDFEAVVFNERVKHGALDFHPSVHYAFEDPDAVDYFTDKTGWGIRNGKAKEGCILIGKDELDIDPETVWGSGERRGELVMGGSANG